MLRNIDSRFSQAPMELDLPRSRFNRDYDHKTTFNAGDLVPIFYDEVLPGDTFDLKLNSVCRMSTPIFPVMDNAYLETFFFFVPTRLVWDHWKEFNGENNESYWTQPTEYNVPQLILGRHSPEANTFGFVSGSVGDHFGLPIDVGSYPGEDPDEYTPLTVSALPFRAYVKIWNDWFRDQNTMQPAYMSTDDTTRTVAALVNSATGDPVDPRTGAQLGGPMLKVSKYHDYFTSALPAPQKGPGVSVSGALNVSKDPAVFSKNVLHEYNVSPVKISPNNNRMVNDIAYNVRLKAESPNTGTLVPEYNNGVMQGIDGADLGSGMVVRNLYTTFAGTDPNVSLLVNDIRLAFQIQRLYEKDARGGTRYIEVIKSHFGVDSPDARLQRSEYLGGTRQPIQISQVIQTSSTDSTSPLGTAAAFSLTNGRNDTFIKSFTEHGMIIGLACVRTDHTYQQGINRMFSRKRRFDYYWPALANIGEQAILKKEILATGSRYDDEAFGYQEAWAEYRYHPSVVSGAFRSQLGGGSLDAWHYADFYDLTKAATMVIDEEFTLETAVNIDRTLAVPSTMEDQFLADFYFDCDVTRVMPLYSIPGLIDHH